MATVISGDTGIDKVTDGSIAQADLAANVAGNGPSFRAYATGTTSLTGGAATLVALANDSTAGIGWDTHNAFDTSTYRFTPQVAGYYILNASVSTATASYLIQVYIYKNGSLFTASSAMTTSVLGFSTTCYLNGSTDYVDMRVYSGTTQNATAVTEYNHFSGSLVRAA